MTSACLDDAAVAALHRGDALPPPQLAHLASCADCRTLVVAVGVAPVGPAAAPARIGRYVLGEVLGHGAMGVVYRAHDPELGRDVALKVLRAAAPGQLAEAQAMARIAHPSVVRVYDAGVHDGEVYLTMELVDGATLATWCAAAPRRRGELLRGLIAVAEGLDAIHAAGLVHRDVKPSNVLVGRDGTWRVSDLGLAGPAEAPGGGTPAYMAPEQQRGMPVDARADQYALAVTMHEVLAGARPTADAALGDGLPRALRAIVRRAGQREPAARYPAMAAMVAALRAAERQPSRRRRLAFAGVGLGAAVAATALAATHLRAAPHAPAPCGGGAAALAERWSGDEAWPGWPRADATRLDAALDSYGAAWVDARGAACRATEIDRVQPPAVMHARQHCLAERLAELGEVVAIARGATDAAARARALTAALGLSPLDACADVVAIDTRVPAPTGDAAATQLDALYAAVGEAKARLRAGDAAAVVTALTPRRSAAQALGHAPLLADVEYQLGSAHETLAAYDAAEPLLRAAAQDAARGRDDALQASAWLQLSYLVGFRRQTPAAAQAWLAAASAAIARAGEPPRLVAQLALYQGTLAMVAGDIAGAVAHYRDAADQAVAVLPIDDPRLAAFFTNLGIAEQAAGHLDAAAAALRRGLRVREATLGDHHPDLASSLLALGQLEVVRGNLDIGTPQLRRALAIRREVWGDDHPDVAAAWTSLGSAERQRGDLAAARAAHQAAIRIWTAAVGPDHLTLSPALTNLGTVELQAGNAAAAEALFRRALTIQQGRGAPHPSLATAWLNLGEARRLQGACADAVPAFTEALRLRTALLGATHVDLAYPLVGLGECALRDRRRAAAHAYFERALTLRTDGDASPAERAEARFGLARATGDRRAAAALADAAFAESPSADLRAEIAAWREARR